MPTTYSVRPVTEHEQQQAISALVTAFGQDPVMRWAFPDPQQYLTHFPEFARLFGGRAFESGTAYCAGDFVATALWLPPGVQPDEEGLVGRFAAEAIELLDAGIHHAVDVGDLVVAFVMDRARGIECADQ